MIILGEMGTPSELQELEKCFPRSDAEEEFDFPYLHKLTVKSRHQDLSDALEIYKSQINARDSVGRTSLHWAVQKSYIKTIQILIRSGIEVDSPDGIRRTPLHISLSVPSKNQYLIVQVLLEEDGVDIHAKEEYGLQALHLACQYRVGLDVIKLLVSKGASVDSKSNLGLTPFHYLGMRIKGMRARTAHALEGDTCEIAEYLLKEGADLNSRDSNGDSVLNKTVYEGRHKFCDMLLSKGADCTQINKSGRTILHTAAMVSNIECIQVLRLAKLKGLDPHLEDRKGKTAKQYLHERTDPPKGFVDAFEQLLQSIQETNEASVTQEAAKDQVIK